MAFFKFRARGHKGDEPPASPAESIDDMRRRARHRLIGATVLVAIGVLGFPLVFDSQPRQVQVDIPIQIPDRDTTRAPGGASGRVAQAEPASAPTSTSTPAPSAGLQPSAGLDAKEEVLTEPAPAAAPPAPAKAADAKGEPRNDTKAADAKAEPRTDTKTAPAKAIDDGARAKALLEGRTTVAAASPAPAAPSPAQAQGGRFVVQVGAFADADKARETRMRLERAGLKTYTQEVQTPEGRRIRVRVGPFSDRAEADKVAQRVKGLSLPASVLTL